VKTATLHKSLKQHSWVKMKIRKKQSLTFTFSFSFRGNLRQDSGEKKNLKMCKFEHISGM